jgi:adenylate cyclase
VAANFGTRNLPEGLRSAEALARRAVALDGADAEARSLLGRVLWLQGDYEGGRTEAERALATSPNLAYAHGTLGAILIFSGRSKEGLVALERSIKLDPSGPISGQRLHHVAIGHYFCRDYKAE